MVCDLHGLRLRHIRGRIFAPYSDHRLRAINLAEQLVAFSGLYSAEKWEGADDLTKADMLCASIVQELNSGNGVMSVNVLTGEFRMFMSDSTGQGLGYYDECTKAMTRMAARAYGQKERRSIRNGHDEIASDEMKRNSGF